jgi:hypothetical protein
MVTSLLVCWLLDAGYWFLDTGCWMLDIFEYSILNTQ